MENKASSVNSVNGRPLPYLTHCEFLSQKQCSVNNTICKSLGDGFGGIVDRQGISVATVTNPAGTGTKSVPSVMEDHL